MARRARNPLPKVEYLDRVDDERRKKIDGFLAGVGVRIKDYNLVNRALSHKSHTNEKGYSHNEQSEKLEFFGDGVLGLVINEYLFKVFPDHEEGELAKIKSAVVSEASLASVAGDIGLADVILVGRSEMRGGGVTRPSLLADILEAFIGAIYIDQGISNARQFILRYFESQIRSFASERSVGDYKSYLQENVQKHYGERPVYSVMKSSGPDHSRTFRVSVSFGGRKWGTGEGRSKKEAEQNAAEIGFEAWEKHLEGGKRHERAVSRRNVSGGRAVASAERAVRDEDERDEAGEQAAPAEKNSGERRRGRRRGGSREASRRLEPVSGPRESADLYVPPPDVADPVAWAAFEDLRMPRLRKEAAEPLPKPDQDEDSAPHGAELEAKSRKRRRPRRRRTRANGGS